MWLVLCIHDYYLVPWRQLHRTTSYWCEPFGRSHPNSAPISAPSRRRVDDGLCFHSWHAPPGEPARKTLEPFCALRFPKTLSLFQSFWGTWSSNDSASGGICHSGFWGSGTSFKKKTIASGDSAAERNWSNTCRLGALLLSVCCFYVTAERQGIMITELRPRLTVATSSSA